MSSVEWADWDKRKTPKVIHVYRTGTGYLCKSKPINVSWPDSKMNNKEFIMSLPVCPKCLEMRG